MRLLVGTPVLRREWIIQSWMSHTLDAIAALDDKPDVAFLFIGGEDDPTFELIDNITQAIQLPAHVIYVEEPRDVDHRRWDTARYHRMVDLRNTLLGTVREMAPTYYLSLDTDILLHPMALRNLIESSQQFDAVGGRLYMTPKHRSAPSNMMISGRNSQRHDAEGVIKVECIMACKLMTPPAYHIDYEWDRRGEDIGICRAWRRAGLRIGYDGRVGNKHIMEQKYLYEMDARVGW